MPRLFLFIIFCYINPDNQLNFNISSESVIEFFFLYRHAMLDRPKLFIVYFNFFFFIYEFYNFLTFFAKPFDLCSHESEV